MSRSEFFAVAAIRYLDLLDRESVTTAINSALERTPGDESLGDVVAHGRAFLAADGEEW